MFHQTFVIDLLQICYTTSNCLQVHAFKVDPHGDSKTASHFQLSMRGKAVKQTTFAGTYVHYITCHPWAVYCHIPKAALCNKLEPSPGYLKKVHSLSLLYIRHMWHRGSVNVAGWKQQCATNLNLRPVTWRRSLTVTSVHQTHVAVGLSTVACWKQDCAAVWDFAQLPEEGSIADSGGAIGLHVISISATAQQCQI